METHNEQEISPRQQHFQIPHTQTVSLELTVVQSNIHDDSTSTELQYKIHGKMVQYNSDVEPIVLIKEKGPISYELWLKVALRCRVVVRPVCPMFLLVSSSSSCNVRHSLLPRGIARAHLRGASLPLTGTFRIYFEVSLQVGRLLVCAS